MGVIRRSFSDETLWADDVQDSSPSLDPDSLLEGLTDPQRRAVVQRGGPLLVIAGAGSGKTRVLTRRIAHILATGDARAYEIMAITFTNKAADEMRRRVVELVGDDAKNMWVSTFHSACLRMLRAHADVLGYERGFTIYDAGDAESAVERIMKELNLDTKRISPRSVASAISAAKNEMLSAERYADLGRGDDPIHRRVAEIYRLYETRLKLANAMDFDDLLLNAVAMLRADASVLESYQRRFKYLLVDEFQDTNGVQNELVMMLAATHRNLCVVGDSDQSIYRFRAADVRNILQFEERFPDADVILLEQNFRSTQTILDAANAVIAKNASRHAKNLFTDHGPGERIRLYRAGDEYDEGRWVATELRRARVEAGIEWNQMAVFYRTNAQSRVLEEEMLRARIPYRVISGMRFYDRKEIKTALAYARLIVNPRDEASARRVINEPKRGVGDAAQSKLHLLRRGRPLRRRRRAQRQGVDRGREVRVHHGRTTSNGQRPHAARDDRRHRARDGDGRRTARGELRRVHLTPGEPGRTGVRGGAVRHVARLRRAHGPGGRLRSARRRRGGDLDDDDARGQGTRVPPRGHHGS